MRRLPSETTAGGVAEVFVTGLSEIGWLPAEAVGCGLLGTMGSGTALGSGEMFCCLTATRDDAFAACARNVAEFQPKRRPVRTPSRTTAANRINPIKNVTR